MKKKHMINKELWKKATDYSKAEYVDMIPSIDIHDSKYLSAEGYLRNNIPREVKIFLKFNNQGKDGELIIETKVLQEAHDYYYELQKKTILLERKIIELQSSNRIAKLYI